MKPAKAALRQSGRPIIIIASLVLIYTLIGFFLLPWLAERQLVNTLQQRLGVIATVEQIQFNPYTFQATIKQLQLTTEEGTSLVAWEQLNLNLQPTKLVQLTLRIEEINVNEPTLHLRRYSTSDNTLSRLTERWTASAKEDTSEAQAEQKSAEQADPLFIVEIGEFNVVDGRIHYRDEVPDEKFETVLSPINIQVTDFSTEAEQTASKNLVIALEKEARLTLNGRFSLSPLHLAGEAELDNFSLQTPYRYLQDQLPFELNEGRLNLQLKYDVDVDTADVDLKDIDVEMADFSIHRTGMSEPLLTGGTLSVAKASYDYPENLLNINEVSLNDFELLATQNKQGDINWLQLMAAMPDQTADEAASTDNDQPPLQLNIANIRIDNTRLAVEDQMPDTPANLLLMLSASLQDFSLTDDQQMPFTSHIRLDSGGDIAVGGDLQLLPVLAVAGEVNIAQLSLLPLQAYLTEYAHIDLVDGKIDSSAKIRTDRQEPFAFQGKLSLNHVQLDNQKLDEKLLSLESLSVNNVDFSLAEQRLAISEVIVDALYSRVLINENGETNLALLMKEQAPGENDQADKNESNGSKGYDLSLGRVEINNASSRFTDQNLPIIFNAHMQKLNGEISSFSTRSKQPMDIALEGQVDEFGLVVIDGKMNPLNVTEKTTVNLSFSNLDLPAMSPYTIKFAGREIDEGRGDVSLTYEIINNKLDASNNIVISDIRLGERIESPDAMDLPLDLAVALLKNSEGVIELSIPVSGDVDDPQFAMGPVIRGAISNALANIVSAPFRFLANLIGGDEAPIDKILFRAGRSDLAPPEQQKLNKLAEALSQRPGLGISIPASFNEIADRKSLKQAAVEAHIDSRLSEDVSDEQLTVRRQKVLEELYIQAGLSPDLQRLQQKFSAPADNGEQAEPELDVLAYNAHLKEQVVEAEPVSITQLQNLAKRRQSAVVDYLKQQSGLDDKQLITGDIGTTEIEDGWLSMKFELVAI